jgi:ribonuclease H2 subunit B
LHEITWYKQQLSSWFVGDSVLADGGMYLCTPVDPLLILLPVLEQCRGEGTFCDLENVLERVGAAAAPLLAALVRGQVECLSEFKDAGGERYYRFSEAKALAWLRLKVEQGVAALRAAPDGAFGGMDGSLFFIAIHRPEQTRKFAFMRRQDAITV